MAGKKAATAAVSAARKRTALIFLASRRFLFSPPLAKNTSASLTSLPLVVSGVRRHPQQGAAAPRPLSSKAALVGRPGAPLALLTGGVHGDNFARHLSPLL